MAKSAVQSAKAKLSRPSRTKPTAKEARERLQAYRIGARLNLRVMQALDRNLRVHEAAVERLDGRSQLSASERERLEHSMMTNYDLLGLTRDLQDRFGTPKRSQVDLDLQGAPPTILVLPDSLWEDKADAAGADRG